MKLSKMIQELPPEQLNRMQQLMHNLRGGFDVRKDMEEFERSLPQGFRETLMSIMAEGAAPPSHASGASETPQPTELPGNMKEARLTLLRAVADGRLSPDEAERMLFPEG